MKNKIITLVFLLAFFYASSIIANLEGQNPNLFDKNDMQIYEIQKDQIDLPKSTDSDPLMNYTTDAQVKTVAISSNGSYIVAGSYDRNIYFFNKSNSTPMWNYTTGDIVYRKVAISANGDYIAAGSYDRHLYFFNKTSSTPLWNYTATFAMTQVAISSDGNYIVAGAGTLIFLFNKSSSTPLWNFTTSGSIESVAISSNGSYIAAGSGDYNVYFFNKSSSTPMWNYTAGHAIRSVDISEDGYYIAAGSWDDKVYLFNKSSSTPMWSYTTGGFLSAVAISSNGGYIVAGNYDNYLYLFNKSSSTPIWSYNTPGSVYSVAISLNGNYIAAGGGPNIYCFHRSSPTPLLNYLTGSSVESVAISSDASYLAAGSNDNKFYLFNVIPDYFILTSDADTPDIDGDFNLTWTASESANNYSIYTHNKLITEINDSITLIDSEITDLNYLVSKLGDGRYYYMVVAHNDVGNRSSNCIFVDYQIIPQINFEISDFYLNTTRPLETDLGLKINCSIPSSQIMEWVYLCENSTGSFVNRSLTFYSDDLWSYNLDISSLVKNNKIIFSFFANTSFGNNGYNDNGGLNFTVLIDDFYRDSIIIDGNANFTSQNGVRNPWATGTKEDPFIIENWIIDGNSIGNCIEIRNSYAYFIIRNCTVFNSSAGADAAGIKLSNTYNGTLINNDCSNNNRYGIYLSDSDNNTVSNNTVNSNNNNGIYLYYSNNNTVSGCTANYNPFGIQLSNSHNNTVSGCTTSHNTNRGIWLTVSDNNIISGNTANNNTSWGIILTSSHNNTVSGNIANNTTSCDGIRLSVSHDNIISGNTANNNTRRGIWLSSSDNNIISGNTANNNTKGIYLEGSDLNTISRNTANCNDYGIYLEDSNNNTVSNSTLISNTVDWIYEVNCVDNTIISNYCDSDGDGLPDNAFIIDDTGGGDYTWAQASSQSWVRGSGAWNDPYVIENLTIDGRNTTTCIEIRNSYAYFIIRNCTVFNSSTGADAAGIKLSNTYNGTLINNDCSNNNRYGIYLSDSDNNTVSNNIVSYNDVYGIYLSYSDNNTVSNNTVNSNNNYGIYLSDSHNNTVSGGMANYNNYGIYLSDSHNNTVSGCTTNYNTNRGIYLDYSDNNTVSGCTANYNPFGIQLSNSHNNTVSGCTTSHNTNRGIWLTVSDNNIISENTANNNTSWGIILTSSHNNTVSGNIANNTTSCDGIRLSVSHDNIISGNTANNHTRRGIWLSSSDNNIISGNTANNNTKGIYLEGSDLNTIFQNNILNNQDTGVELESSCNGNTIYYNNIADNNIQARDDGSNNNWDNEKVGNNWSDYVNIYPLATNDGFVWNTPYEIDGSASSQDNYPLVNYPLLIISFEISDIYLNTTRPLETDLGLEINCLVSDLLPINWVYLCENSTGSFVNRFMTQGINNLWNYSLDISSLVEGNKLMFYFYASNSFGISYLDNGGLNFTILIDDFYIDPILINGKDDFTSQNGVRNPWAAGTEEDPFIIENWIIDGGTTGTCIDILNSDVFFIIRNCTVFNSQVGPIGTDPFFHAGIRLFNVSNAKIIDNNCSNNRFTGIRLYYNCNYNTIEGNIANKNPDIGIFLRNGSHNNIIYNNICNNNSQWGISLYENCDYNIINSNTVNSSEKDGIYILSGCDNNIIFNNSIESNQWGGILIENTCSNNKIFQNKISNNQGTGINIESSCNGNIVYYNQITDNNVQAKDNGLNNNWDNEGIGNKWSDYTTRYPSAGNDGFVWNISYEISGSTLSQDNYPLCSLNPMIGFKISSDYLNTTAPLETDVGLEITCSILSWYNLEWVYLCENSNGTFVNRSMSLMTNGKWIYIVNISDLNAGDVLIFSFFVKYNPIVHFDNSGMNYSIRVGAIVSVNGIADSSDDDDDDIGDVDLNLIALILLGVIICGFAIFLMIELNVFNLFRGSFSANRSIKKQRKANLFENLVKKSKGLINKSKKQISKESYAAVENWKEAINYYNLALEKETTLDEKDMKNLRDNIYDLYLRFLSINPLMTNGSSIIFQDNKIILKPIYGLNIFLETWLESNGDDS